MASKRKYLETSEKGESKKKARVDDSILALLRAAHKDDGDHHMTDETYVDDDDPEHGQENGDGEEAIDAPKTTLTAWLARTMDMKLLARKLTELPPGTYKYTNADGSRCSIELYSTMYKNMQYGAARVREAARFLLDLNTHWGGEAAARNLLNNQWKFQAQYRKEKAEQKNHEQAERKETLRKLLQRCHQWKVLLSWLFLNQARFPATIHYVDARIVSGRINPMPSKVIRTTLGLVRLAKEPGFSMGCKVTDFSCTEYSRVKTGASYIPPEFNNVVIPFVPDKTIEIVPAEDWSKLGVTYVDPLNARLPFVVPPQAMSLELDRVDGSQLVPFATANSGSQMYHFVPPNVHHQCFLDQLHIGDVYVTLDHDMVYLHVLSMQASDICRNVLVTDFRMPYALCSIVRQYMYLA